MKILVIQFPEDTAITIAKGKSVSISDGANTMTDGEVVYIIDGVDPEVPSHIHDVAGTTGPPG